MRAIHHIKTGGTIGGCIPEYQEIETLAKIFPDMIDFNKYLTQSLKVFADYTEKTICHKDSREVTDEDREKVVEDIKEEYKNGTRKFIVTHGTYTMPETGKYIDQNLSEEIKSSSQILVTGSMYPWTVLGSDAPINLGAALGVMLNTDEPLLKICMHAKFFDPYKVKKDTVNLIFVDEDAKE